MVSRSFLNRSATSLDIGEDISKYQSTNLVLICKYQPITPPQSSPLKGGGGRGEDSDSQVFVDWFSFADWYLIRTHLKINGVTRAFFPARDAVAENEPYRDTASLS